MKEQVTLIIRFNPVKINSGKIIKNVLEKVIISDDGANEYLELQAAHVTEV